MASARACSAGAADAAPRPEAVGHPSSRRAPAVADAIQLHETMLVTTMAQTLTFVLAQVMAVDARDALGGSQWIDRQTITSTRSSAHPLRPLSLLSGNTAL